MDIGYQFAKRLHEQGALAGRAVRLTMKRDALPESNGRRGGLTLSVTVLHAAGLPAEAVLQNSGDTPAQTQPLVIST